MTARSGICWNWLTDWLNSLTMFFIRTKSAEKYFLPFMNSEELSFPKMWSHDNFSTPTVSCSVVRTSNWQILNSRSETTFPPTPFSLCSEKKKCKDKREGQNLRNFTTWGDPVLIHKVSLISSVASFSQAASSKRWGFFHLIYFYNFSLRKMAILTQKAPITSVSYNSRKWPSRTQNSDHNQCFINRKENYI